MGQGYTVLDGKKGIMDEPICGIVVPTLGFCFCPLLLVVQVRIGIGWSVVGSSDILVAPDGPNSTEIPPASTQHPGELLWLSGFGGRRVLLVLLRVVRDPASAAAHDRHHEG